MIDSLELLLLFILVVGFQEKFLQCVRLLGLAESCEVKIAMVLRNSLPQDVLKTKIINEFVK